ncbi:S-layer homology domain-containing protein [Deltaproteobacteria bacterium TL4]
MLSSIDINFLTIKPQGAISDGNILILGSGFGNNLGSIEITVKSTNVGYFSGRIAPVLSSPNWSDQIIQINLFQNQKIISNNSLMNNFNYAQFNWPILIKLKRSDGINIGSINYPFKDVTYDEWFGEYVISLWKQGVVKGQGDTGYFTPSKSTNFAEFFKMLIEISPKHVPIPCNAEDAPILFEGVTPDDWFCPYYKAVNETTWLEQFTWLWNNYYLENNVPLEQREKRGLPGQNVHRNEAVFFATIAASFRERLPGSGFYDTENDPFKVFIRRAKYHGIIKGYPNTLEFKPESEINRADMALVLYRTFILRDNEDFKKSLFTRYSSLYFGNVVVQLNSGYTQLQEYTEAMYDSLNDLIDYYEFFLSSATEDKLKYLESIEWITMNLIEQFLPIDKDNKELSKEIVRWFLTLIKIIRDEEDLLTKDGELEKEIERIVIQGIESSNTIRPMVVQWYESRKNYNSTNSVSQEEDIVAFFTDFLKITLKLYGLAKDVEKMKNEKNPFPLIMETTKSVFSICQTLETELLQDKYINGIGNYHIIPLNYAKTYYQECNESTRCVAKYYQLAPSATRYEIIKKIVELQGISTGHFSLTLSLIPKISVWTGEYKVDVADMAIQAFIDSFESRYQAALKLVK